MILRSEIFLHTTSTVGDWRHEVGFCFFKIRLYGLPSAIDGSMLF